MNLEQVEAKAEALAAAMLATDSRQERTHHMWALEGLHRLTQIKATAAYRREQALPNLVPLGAEPTKPAVDRLHELVSYLVRQSDHFHDYSGQASIAGKDEEAVKHMAVCKAYDDAATKLDEILREGFL